MKSDNISFDDMMNTIMNLTQRDAVLQCIRLMDPEYQIRYREINTANNCPLLKNLKAKNKYHCPTYKGVYITSDDLKEMVRTQIITERKGNLKVKSIALFKGDLQVREQAVS